MARTNILTSGVIISAIVYVAAGASLLVDENILKATVRDVLKAILNESNTRETDDVHQAFSEIVELKNRTNILEQRMQDLTQSSLKKDAIIQSLQVRMRQLYDSLGTDKRNASGSVIYDSANVLFADDSVVTPTRHTMTIPAIAFSAYLDGTQSNLAPGQTIKFNRVLLNDGHGYNSYIGTFIAPVSGTYFFTFQIDSRVHTFVRLNVDGVNIVDAVANPHITSTENREMMAGNSAIIHVGIGQSVSVEVYDVSGEAASSNKYRLSSFSGVLLYPE